MLKLDSVGTIYKDSNELVSKEILDSVGISSRVFFQLVLHGHKEVKLELPSVENPKEPGLPRPIPQSQTQHFSFSAFLYGLFYLWIPNKFVFLNKIPTIKNKGKNKNFLNTP